MSTLFRFLYYLCLSTVMLCQAACNNKSSDELTDKGQYIDIENLENEAIYHPDTVSLSGRVVLSGRDGSGCFYVDPEMISAGLTQELGDKENARLCQHPTYGNGAIIDFSGLQEEADYPNPPEGEHLIIVSGIWTMQAYNRTPRVYVFYAEHYEPLF